MHGGSGAFPVATFNTAFIADIGYIANRYVNQIFFIIAAADSDPVDPYQNFVGMGSRALPAGQREVSCI